MMTFDEYEVMHNRCEMYKFSAIKAILQVVDPYSDPESAVPSNTYFYSIRDGNPTAIWFEVDSWNKEAGLTAHTDGYIDHQSGPDESDDCERLAKMFRDDPDELYGFVFGDAYIIIDNDND